jgi:uncharacterized phiE125 gp8 family phage protein
MHVSVITPPAPIVTWEEADTHLRLDGDTSQKPFVEALIAAAQGNIDGPSGWLGRCVGVQTLEATVDCFDFGVCLPYPPIISIVAVKYDDPDGIEQTLDPAAYRLDATGSLVCQFGGSWPTTRSDRGVIRVRYSAGYPTPPAAIKAALLLMVSHLFNNRDAVTSTQAQPAVLPLGVDYLLQPHRVIGV